MSPDTEAKFLFVKKTSPYSRNGGMDFGKKFGKNLVEYSKACSYDTVVGLRIHLKENFK
jgi:hypothetical protein